MPHVLPTRGTHASCTGLLCKIVQSRLVITYEPPSDKEHAHAAAAVELLNGVDEEAARHGMPGDAPLLVSRRHLACERLLTICAGPWTSRDHIYHYCHLACNCRGREDAVQLVVRAVEDAFMGSRPPVPALNKWGQVYAPVAWWMFAGHFHSVPAQAFIKVSEGELRDEDEGPIDPLAPRDENVFSRVKLGRLRRQAR